MTMMPPTYRDDETTSRKMYLQVERIGVPSLNLHHCMKGKLEKKIDETNKTNN